MNIALFCSSMPNIKNPRTAVKVGFDFILFKVNNFQRFESFSLVSRFLLTHLLGAKTARGVEAVWSVLGDL